MNLISGFLLCRDGFKLVFKLNKFFVSKFGLFVGKRYDSGGLFRLLVIDNCNNVANFVSYSELTAWGYYWHKIVIHLSNLNLIPKIHVIWWCCVQAKQPRMPFKRVKEKSLSPLDLIHFDVCEMNGILTRAV
jgi:hypothetical protein